MTDELRDLDEELNKLCQDVRKGIDGLGKMKGSEKQNKIAYLQGRITRAKQVYRNLKLELRDMPKVDAEPWQKKVKEYMESINKLNQDLTWHTSDKEALIGTTKAEEDPDTMNTKQVLEKASDIQKKDISSLDETLKILDQTKEVGANIGIELKKQTEQLQKTKEGVHEVQQYLKMANKQLRALARRVATDKLIMSFICLIVCGIIVIIVYSIVKGKTSSSSSSASPTTTG